MPFLITILVVIIGVMIAIAITAAKQPKEYLVIDKDKRLKTVRHFGYVSFEVEWYLVVEDTKEKKQYIIPVPYEEWQHIYSGDYINKEV